MLCSIVIVCKNNLAEVKLTLSSVLVDKNFSKLCECIIVDDSHKDEIEKYIKFTKFDNIAYFRGDRKSLYSAMNIGIEKSIGKYVWFLNSGDRKISSHFCFFLTIISFKLWAEPIILNDLGKLKLPM